MTVLSGVIRKGKLVGFEEWSAYIDTLRRDIENSRKGTDYVKVANTLSESVHKRLPKKRFGVMLSGGVDSSVIALLCKKARTDFICYTIGMEHSPDIIESGKAAEELGLRHKKKILTLEDAESLFSRTAAILGKLIDIVNLGVGSVMLGACEMAKKDKITEIFTGLGSEEIFAGYQRHELSQDINQECWSGLKSMWHRDFQRDFVIGKHEKITFLTPFLDKKLITEGMKATSEQKIRSGIKKHILREAALYLGLPCRYSFRKKSAAQYGSNIDKAILKIAKRKGFSAKSGYLKNLSNNK